MIQIKEVITKQQLSEFIEFPDALYKGNKYRVPQLHVFEKATLLPEKNKAFEFCEAKFWLAFKGMRIVGRIAGIINHKSNEIWNENVVRFGWIDFTDDFEVSTALIHSVKNWGKSKGMSKMDGPLGFTDLDFHGMLIEGYSELSTHAVLYNYPYYPIHLEKHGFEKAVDWIQYEINVPVEVPEKIIRISELVKQRYGLRILKINKAKDILPYAEKMFAVLNESYANLYGFVALTDKQIAYYTEQYFSFINPKYVCFILDKKDDVVGFGITILSLSKALIKSKGKLFPFGSIHLLNALRKNDTVDMLLQGIKPQYFNKGIPAIFFAEIMQAYIDNGIKKAISSQALEKNRNAFLMFENFEHRQHIRSRSYTKNLTLEKQ